MRIIDDNIFESLQLYEADTPINQAVTPMMRKIVSRLFQGTEVDIHDFYFTVFEDENPNAFFMSKDHTTDKQQHIIAISRGLLDACQKEAELAGIIGHECGHFLWGEILGGRNTIFQERAADLRAIDLMINGGYNPVHHLDTCQRLAGIYGRRYSDITIDVHGNDLARVEDVKARLTMIANECGDFAIPDSTPDQEYLIVQQKAREAYAKEGYDTYLEKILIANYGTKDIDKLTATQVLNVVLSETKVGNLDISARINDTYNTIMELSRNHQFNDKSSELTELCQKVFMTMRERGQVNSDMMKTILRSFKIPPFGDFVTQIENIKNFVNYQSKEDAVKYAREIYKLRWTLGYAHDIEDVEYAQLNPRGQDNIGKKLPKQELQDWCDGKELNEEDRQALQWTLDALTDGRVIDKTRYAYSSPYFNSDEYFFDKQGKVVVYGPEAVALNREEELRAASESFLQGCQNNKETFDKQIEFFDTLAAFSLTDNNDNKRELAQKIASLLAREDSYIYKQSLHTGYFGHNPTYLHNPYASQILETFNASLTKKYFADEQDADIRAIRSIDNYHTRQSDEKNIRGRKLSEPLLKAALATLDDKAISQEIESQTDTGSCRDFNKKINDSLLELADYVYTEFADKETYFALHDMMYTSRFLSPFSSGLTYEYGEYEEYAKKSKDQIQSIEKAYNNSTRASEQKRLMHATKIKPHIIRLTNGGALSVIEQYALKNFSLNEESPLLNNVLTTFGFNPKSDIDGILKHLDHTSGHTNENSVFNQFYNNGNRSSDILTLWDQAGIVISADIIRKNPDFDLKNLMKYLRDCRTTPRFSPIVTDIFAQAIQKGDKFNSLSLKDKIYVYEVMDDLQLFSDEYANKSEFFKTITHEIINHPDKQEAAKIAEKLLSKQYAAKPYMDGILKTHHIEFAKEKDDLIDFYAQCKADRLGQDDGSDAFYQKASQVADEICAPLNFYYEPDKFPRTTLQSILNRISTKITSQEMTAQMLDEKGSAKFSQHDAEKHDYSARAAEAIISALANSAKSASAVIDFLSKKCTKESINQTLTPLRERSDITHNIENTGLALGAYALKLVHENFWHADLPIRAYMMNRLLKAYSQKDEDILNLVVDMHFDKTSPYYKESKRVVKAVFDHLQPYERNLVLAALVASNQRDPNNQNNTNGGEAIGEGLKMFFENKGPAFVKFGQLLSYLPVLDPDIRKPLAKLRDKADIPSRAELFKLMKETVPDEELAKITKVGKILGAGSFFITTQIEYEGKPCVISLMRPHAKELAESGMNMIYDTIVDLSRQDNMYKPLLNIANQARISAMSEIDIEADHAKFCEATKIYDDLKITTPQGEFKPEVAKWMSYGSGKDGQVYKIMNMAEGMSMTSSKMSEQVKHDMAVAYVTLELTNLLSGGKWDTDRHQGQQNFAEDGFKKFVIGIFDTGAQIQHAPDTKDKLLLGELLYGMARAARTGKNMADYMVQKVKRIDKAGDIFKFDTLYIDEVQRGLTALSDIITYQKEVKDEKGRIVQPEKSLSGKELGDIIGAVLSSGLVDRHVQTSLAAKAIINKIRFARKGWYSSLNEGLKKMSSPISITKQENPSPAPQARRCDKPQQEIEALQKAESSTRRLGVSTKHIDTTKAIKHETTSLAALIER